MNQMRLEVDHISKTYKGVYALKDVSVVFEPGEIHALLGENGAGKSTLCKILSGAIVPDSGKIKINGQEFDHLTPASAKTQGISMIYQEFNLIPEMTVYENLFLGKEIRRGIRLNKAEMIRQTQEVFERLNVSIDPKAKIKSLSVAYCQLVEIGKALMENVQFMIMDEPTAPLTMQEVDILLNLVRELKASGVTIIYISHRIEELLALSDRVTVLRDGETVRTLHTAQTNRAELIRLMVGREMGTEYPQKSPAVNRGEVVLKVENLITPKVHNLSFELHRGEILGLGGLVGAGRSETVRAIFGADPIQSGSIYVAGKQVKIHDPKDAIACGIGLIPEDRKNQGLHLQLPIGLNISLIRIQELCKPKFTISKQKEKALIEHFVRVLSIKMASPLHSASSLSGGNQQKVVLAKWLSTNAEVFIFDEPTRGIDVGAKREIYALMDSLRKQNKGNHYDFLGNARDGRNV